MIIFYITFIYENIPILSILSQFSAALNINNSYLQQFTPYTIFPSNI